MPENKSITDDSHASYNDNTYNDPTNVFMATGVFSTPQIEYYVQKYAMIVNFDKSCLKAAVYEMRLGDLAVRWANKTALRFHLRETAPERGESLYDMLRSMVPASRLIWPVDMAVSTLVLPPNSLTFVSVHEKFNLPRDVIARFNLKSAFVHKGLLLGGGPIIDPGYKSGLVLPIHNFSNVPIQINYREPIIKVEFNRTMNPDAINLDGKDYSPLFNDKAIIDDEYFFNNTRYVESSVYAAIEKNADLLKSFSNKLRLASIASIVALVALITAFYNLIINISNVSDNAIVKMHETQEKLADFSNRNEKYLRNMDVELGELIEQIKRMKGGEDLAAIEKKAETLRRELRN